MEPVVRSDKIRIGAWDLAGPVSACSCYVYKYCPQKVHKANIKMYNACLNPHIDRIWTSCLQANVFPFVRFPHFFQIWNSMTYQGFIKKKITLFKHYRIVIWCIVNALFCVEITCHTPNYNIHHVENTDHRVSSDGFDDEIIESPQFIKIICENASTHTFTHNQIKFLVPLFFKLIDSNFQALFKENCQFSRQIENSSTFQDRSQTQALFKV